MSELGLPERIKKFIKENGGRARFTQITGKIKIRSNLVAAELNLLVESGAVIKEVTTMKAEIFWLPDAWDNRQGSAGGEGSADTAVDAALVPEALEPDPVDPEFVEADVLEADEFGENLGQFDAALNAVFFGFAEKAGDLWHKQQLKLAALSIANRRKKITIVTECSEFPLFPEHVRQLLAELAVELEKFPDTPNLGG
jgi:hypothetical protein